MRQPVEGYGNWFADQPEGKAHLEFFLDSPAYVDVNVVERYDLGHVYEVNNATNECFEKSTIGSMPPLWAWLAEAANRGHRDFHGHQCEVWEWKIATLTLAACFDHNNYPLVLAKEYGTNDYEVFLFTTFSPHKPSPSSFDVPPVCTKVPTPKRFRMPNAGAPVISDQFESRILVEFSGAHGVSRGDGFWLSDRSSGKARQFYDLQDSVRTVHVDVLERYDRQMIYIVDDVDQGCHKRPTNTTHMPSPWEWVKYAKNVGHQDFHGFYCDVWQASFSGINLSLCVDITDSTHPLIFVEARSRHEFAAWQFDDFTPRAPSSPRAFDIPSVCA